jgi:subtilisin family serine protease
LLTLRGDGAGGASTFYILDVPSPVKRLTQVRRHPRAVSGLLGVFACASLMLPSVIAGAEPVAPIAAHHATDRVLIRWAADADSSLRTQALEAVRAIAIARVSPAAGAPLALTLPRGISPALALKRLAALPGVAAVEPDYLVTTGDVSNDPKFTGGNQWDMYGNDSSPGNQYGSGAAEAWSAGYTGSRGVVVGVIDEGIQFSHPDLAANIWTNPWDPVDGVDNDNNGYKDDVHGWDFFNDDASVYDGNALDSQDSHGTHVSGTIGGVGGNGTGMAGINWQVTIVPAKFLGPGGGYVSDAISALDYLTDLHNRHGLDIVATNNSWGGGGVDPFLQSAIERAGDAGMLFVAAAGNSSANNDGGDAFPSNISCAEHANGTPRGYDCLIAVAAIDKFGALSSFSSYGATTVDLGAPGSDVLSTIPVNSYQSWNGTSMATPHVTGALALCASIGGLRGGELRAALMNSVKATASLAGKTVSGGRLDIGAIVDACSPSSSPVSGGPTTLTANATGPRSVELAWTDGAQNETAFEVQRAPGNLAGCGTFADAGQASANAHTSIVEGLAPGTTHCFRVRATNSFGGGSASGWSNSASATTPTLPLYACVPTTYSWIDATTTGYALDDEEQVRVDLPAGFDFDFYAMPVTWIDISSNGYLDIGTANNPAQAWVNSALPSPDQPSGIAAAWWDDFNPGGVTNIFTQTVGTAPHRVFAVEWLDVDPFTPGSTSGVTFEALLEESTGAITFAYKDVSAGLAGFDAGAGATVGVEEPIGSTATQISYNQATLAAGTAYRCTTDGSSSPPDTSAPTAASPIASLVAPQSLGTTATLHLAWAPSADASGVVSYDLQYSKSGGAWTTVGLASPTQTSVDFGVAPGKGYSFRLRAHDGVGNIGPWATSAVKVNLLQDGASSVSYIGTFKLSSLTGASGGHVRQTGVYGRVARLTFIGSSGAFVSTLGPARGKVDIWLDGVFKGTLDLFSPIIKTRRVVWSTTTGAGTHRLEIRPTGTRNVLATSNRVDVDAFLVQP